MVGTKPNPAKVAAGKQYHIGGILYRVETMTGEDSQYPIVLQEVARIPRVNREIEQRAKLMGQSYILSQKEPRRMTVELPWFIHRPDVFEWTGTAALWLVAMVERERVEREQRNERRKQGKVCRRGKNEL